MFVAGKMMDCDMHRRQTRKGKMESQLVVLPDADISEPECDEEDLEMENNMER